MTFIPRKGKLSTALAQLQSGVHSRRAASAPGLLINRTTRGTTIRSSNRNAEGRSATSWIPRFG